MDELIDQCSVSCHRIKVPLRGTVSDLISQVDRLSAREDARCVGLVSFQLDDPHDSSIDSATLYLCNVAQCPLPYQGGLLAPALAHFSAPMTYEIKQTAEGVDPTVWVSVCGLMHPTDSELDTSEELVVEDQDGRSFAYLNGLFGVRAV